MPSKAVPAIITGALLFWAGAAVSPYVMLSYMAHRQFGEDFMYILPQHDVPSDQAIPDHVCTSDITKLDYSAFVFGAANLVLKIDRPTFLAMHAGVLKSKKYIPGASDISGSMKGTAARNLYSIARTPATHTPESLKYQSSGNRAHQATNPFHQLSILAPA